MAGHHSLLGSAILMLIAPAINAIECPHPVQGWSASGSAATKYSAATETSVVHSGSASASLAATADAEGFEFGTLMQLLDARPHIGERMRLSAYVRTAGVTTGASLWMRVDGMDGQVLGFDNMSRRQMVRGDQAWTPLDVVLDIPAGSKVISFGVLLKGEGMVWIDDVALSPVMKHVATTGFDVQVRLPVAPDELPNTPRNLDFETY